jgi:hypothetical protein
MDVQMRKAGVPKPLVLAMLVAFSAPAPAQTVPYGVSMTHGGAVALRDGLLAQASAVPRGPSLPAMVLPVTSCADDGGSGTLRAAVAAAGDGDTVDLGQLHCSSITLTQGAIPVLLDNLNVVGPGAETLAIDGAGAGRVFVHPGSGVLGIRDVTLRNGAAIVTGNHITGGGCVASAGYLVLDHARVTGCLSSGEGVYGGGIFAYAVFMYTSTVAANIGRGYDPEAGTATFGGGSYSAYAVLVDSTVSANRAERDTANSLSGYETGGGLFTNFGGLVLSSTIEGNYSTGIGGGVSAFGGQVQIADSTISGNVAHGGSGGGADLRVSYESTIANSTITANRAAIGGGVYLRGAARSFNLQSSLIAGNTANSGVDFGAAGALVIAGANNLVAAAGVGVSMPQDTLQADPHLLPLADNGGPTRTHALTPGSQALDAGNNLAALANDQRGAGFPRVVGAAADIGAFEGFVVPAPQPVNVPAATPGVLLLLGLLLASTGLAILRRAGRMRSVFTLLSPCRAHSSHR